MPDDAQLKMEAATVERIRRQITENAQQGQPAAPELLAEFAKAQKAYLIRKIEFEKQKRNSEVTVGASSVTPATFPQEVREPRTQPETAQIPVQAERPCVPTPDPVLAASVSVMPTVKRPSRSFLFVFIALAGIALGVVLWVLSL